MFIIFIVIILIGFLLAFSAKWAIDYFGLSCFEQIIFHLKVPLEGTNTEFIYDWIRLCLKKAMLLTITVCIPLFIPSYMNYFPIIAIIIFITCLIFGAYTTNIFGFIANLFKTSNLYETHYVDANDIEITFPKQKKNLIYIYVESLETIYTSKENGGAYHKDLIPELSKLAKENINFSNTNLLGGAKVISGSGWTTAGIVSQSGGIPLLVPFTTPKFNDHNPFLPGLHSLGDILKKEGYSQTYLIGSDAVFGGRKFYFNQHGKFKIWDLKSSYQEHKIAEDYKVFWGYEDTKLYQFAKEELLTLANKQPFNFTMLSVDTHHPYGYTCSKCENEHPEGLSNVIRCGSKQVGEFIDWIKQQSFYENTTIIITGDHLSMAHEYITTTYDKHYDRTIFNTFINSSVDTSNTQNREFLSFDMFPTTLASMGVSIEGDKLGLGTNLFSNKDTLAEQIGTAYIDKEVRKQSKFYKHKILK